MDQAIRRGIRDHLLAKPLRSCDPRRDIDRVSRTAEHSQGYLRRRTIMRLAQELSARIEHPHRAARRSLPGIRYIRAEDPWVPRPIPVCSLARNAHFELTGLFQFNMVANRDSPWHT